MSNEDIYKAPVATLDNMQESPKPSILVIIMSVVFSVPTGLIMFIKLSNDAGISTGIGGIIGSLIPALVVVLLFQIGKRFRNSRSRWKIFMWTQFFVFLGQVSAILQAIGAST